MKAALVLVDIQNDFCPGGSLAVEHGDEVVEIANRMMPIFKVVVATQDWHPVDHQSFAEQHPSRKPGDQIELHGLTQILWPVHCVQGSKGADFHGQLNTRAVDAVFPKGTDVTVDSYSGFHDNGRRRSTGLADYLREREVTDIFVMGLATDYCVKYTALDGVDEGFRTHLIEDGCRGVELSRGDSTAAISQMRAAGVLIESSAAVLHGGAAEL